MYNQHFGLSETPFSISPDPRYLFMSERHREALAHLLYGLRIDGGFVLLTGEVGTGKTTLCRCLLEQVPAHCDIAFIFNPRLDALELLHSLCDELHIAVPASVRSLKVLIDRLNAHLLDSNARGRKTVLIVDEAQNLSNEVLELLRLLTNLETSQRKLLQIILLGQPELRERLAAPQMRQLAQRVVARYHLEALSREEVSSYVQHRLAVAGARFNLFPPRLLERLFRLSGGTPRLINLICDRALLGAYVKGLREVDMATLNQAAREVLDSPAQRQPTRPVRRGVLALGMLLLASLGVALHPQLFAGFAPAAAPPAATRPAATERRAIQAQQTQAQASSPVVPVTHAVPIPPAEPLAASAIRAPEAAEHWLHEAQAVHSLFARWQVEVQEPTRLAEACQRASQMGLHCLQRQASLAELRRFNTPGIIELRAVDGPAFLATLLELGSQQARLMVAGREQRVSLDSLARQWNGQLTLLWRAPEGWRGSLREGLRDPAVAWIAQRLARWEGQPGQSDPHGAGGLRFSAELAARVRQFQRAHGLQADGVVGQLTLAHLAVLTDPAAPVLAQQVH